MFARDKLSLSESLVRETGVEPARPFGHKILSLARLPVPPLPQWLFYSTGLRTTAPPGFCGRLGRKGKLKRVPRVRNRGRTKEAGWLGPSTSLRVNKSSPYNGH